MKIVCAALTAIIFFTACNTEIAEPSTVKLPESPEQLNNLLLQETKDEAKLDIYYALYKAYRDAEPVKAFDYLNDQKMLAEQLGDHLTSGKACYNMGLIRKQGGDYIEAVNLYLAAVAHFEEVQELTKIALVLNNIGVVFMETGNFEYAEKFLTKAKHHYESIKDSEHLVLVNLNLGVCNYSKKEPDYDLANDYLSKAEEITDGLTQDQDYYLNWIFNSKGAMYYKMQSFTKAKANYILSLNHLQSSESITELKFVAYSNIGEACIGDATFEEARTWIKKAFELVQQGSINPNLIVGSLNIEAELYQQEGNHTMAVSVLENAIKIANTNVINPSLKETLKLLSHSYRELNKAEKAVSASRYDNILRLIETQDALEKELVEETNFKALQAALGLSVELDNKKKEKKAETELKVLYSNITYFLSFIALLAGLLVFRYVRKMYKIRQVLNW